MDPTAVVEAPVEEFSLRDELEEAIDLAETPQTNTTPAPAHETPPVAEEKPEEKPPVALDKAELKAETIPQAPPIPPKKAPSSWSPAQREKWAGLDPELQTQILKREREISNGFNEISEIRKFRESVNQTLSPYQQIFQAEGNNPVRTVGHLLQTASSLYYGSPAQKATTIAAAIKNFGVDIAMLDEILSSGQAPQQQQNQQYPQIQQLINQGVNQALAPIYHKAHQREQQQEQEIISEIQSFADDPTHEFYEDVKATMADILDLAANRNEKMSLQTAYQRAILMHSDIADVVNERKLRESAAKSSQSARRARNAARSISGAPTQLTAGSSSGNSVRDALEDAISQSST